MADISAEQVRELREKSGAGIMDCKRALAATSGNLSEAVEFLRKEGTVKASKKSGRMTLEGLVGLGVGKDRLSASLVELNCETDFVARTDQFQEFLSSVAELIVKDKPKDLDQLQEIKLGNLPLKEAFAQLIAKLGENMTLRRFRLVQASVGEIMGTYLHAGSKIGVVIKLSGSQDEALARDIGMHVAAMSPAYIERSQVPASVIEREKEIAKASPDLAGKPANILGKILEGKVGRYFSEACLLEQPFVKDTTGKKTVGAYLKEKAPNARVAEMVRFQVGEEIA